LKNVARARELGVGGPVTQIDDVVHQFQTGTSKGKEAAATATKGFDYAKKNVGEYGITRYARKTIDREFKELEAKALETKFTRKNKFVIAIRNPVEAPTTKRGRIPNILGGNTDKYD